MKDQKVESTKQADAVRVIRDGGAVAFRLAVLIGMLLFIVVVGLIAYGGRRTPIVGNSSSSGALVLNMASGAAVKNGTVLSGAYESPRAVNVHYIINSSGNTVLDSGSMELNERSQFSRNILIDVEQTISKDATLQVFVRDQEGQLFDTMTLPITIEAA